MGALGNFIDVFDPARARADRDLDSREHQGEIIPSPDDDDRPVRVDLTPAGRTAPLPRPNRSAPSRTACAASAARWSLSAPADASCT